MRARLYLTLVALSLGGTGFGSDFVIPPGTQVHRVQSFAETSVCANAFAHHYLVTTDLVRKRLAQTYRHSKAVSSVVYPFSGPEAPLAFALFPSATTVIALDKVPAVRWSASTSPNFTVVANGGPREGYYHWKDVEDAKEVFPKAVGLLREIFPNLRILAMEIYEENDEHRHARIEFDDGPGTPVRTLWQMHQWLHKSTLRHWIFEGIERLGIDALLMKGAMQHIPDVFSASEPVVKHLLALLSERQGILVEGADGDSDTDFEISYRYTLPGNYHRAAFELSASWGYRTHFQIVQF